MWGVRGGTQPWRLGVTAGQLFARLPLALPFALAYECGCARGIPPPDAPHESEESQALEMPGSSGESSIRLHCSGVSVGCTENIEVRCLRAKDSI